MKPSDLSARLDAYPRVRLAEYPTPLEPLPRLGAELGRRLYIKRDDGIGPALGGNKTASWNICWPTLCAAAMARWPPSAACSPTTPD
ncbi:MAG TPA: hypothetical protein VL334_02095 [Anaerolineae bacterium]|nr:hypothetical protein [Anaerolineae bacterium]